MTNDARMVHKLVKSTAQEMAGAFYEHAAHLSNDFYARYPKQSVFVRKDWQKFVTTARGVLAHMLTLGSTSDHMKAEIYDALLADSTLPYAPKEVQITNFPH